MNFIFSPLRNFATIQTRPLRKFPTTAQHYTLSSVVGADCLVTFQLKSYCIHFITSVLPHPALVYRSFVPAINYPSPQFGPRNLSCPVSRGISEFHTDRQTVGQGSPPAALHIATTIMTITPVVSSPHQFLASINQCRPINTLPLNARCRPCVPRSAGKFGPFRSQF